MKLTKNKKAVLVDKLLKVIHTKNYEKNRKDAIIHKYKSNSKK